MRAELLFQQGRYEQALAEFQQQLRDDPEDAHTLARQSLCLSAMDRYPEAVRQAETAIRWAPDAPDAHFALSRALVGQKKYTDALRSLNQAIALDPFEVVFFGLKSVIHLDQYEWQAALAAADMGLAVDPENASCLNSRIIALTKLGRHVEATLTAENALARNPMVAETHASHGWTLLSNGQWQEARKHFLEALRLDPTSEWAQHGLVESIKARNPVYRLALNYAVQMSRLSPKVQLGLIFGGMIAVNVLGQIGKSAPAFALPATILTVVYLLAVYFIWIAEPLSNLLLRLHPLGKHALSRDQRSGANLIGVCYLIALGQTVMALSGMPLGWEMFFRWIAIVVPASAIFRCAEGRSRRIMAGATGAIALIGIVIPSLCVLPPLRYMAITESFLGLVEFGLLNFWLAIGLSTWLANGLIVASRRWE